MQARAILAGLMLVAGFTVPAVADQRLLAETVEFTGAILAAETKVPGLVLGVVVDGETAVAGFGSVSGQSDMPPDGGTLMRIGSITKVFTGTLLADLVADGRVGLADPLDQHLAWDLELPTQDGRGIRLIDLATHTSGLPREIDAPFGPPEDPFGPHSRAAYQASLEATELLFPPGSGALYSNYGYNLLAFALENATGSAFPELIAERVTEPAGLEATTYFPNASQRQNLFEGHGIDGSPLPDSPTRDGMLGSGGLYSTPDDMLRWLGWHLDRFAVEDAETRLLSHAAYVPRDGLEPVLGMDESGHMDAIGLGWVVMQPEGDRPLILQKAGGMQGILSYVAFAPTRNAGVFVAINAFDFGAALAMTEAANALLAQLAPR